MTEYGWHFLADKNGVPIYRAGEPAKLGDVLTHDGPLVPCDTGLHFSRRPIDALRYAPGPWLCRVRVGGETLYKGDKGIARSREILWLADVTPILRVFARWSAAAVLHLWDPPEVVVRWVSTGDESIRAASRAASWDASWAASAASRVAAWSASWAASRAASWDDSWDTSQVALRDAARDASAASLAASRAASAASWGASLSASSASRGASDAARTAQNKILIMAFSMALNDSGYTYPEVG